MREENGDVLFGTSVLGGFNRRNVLEYIAQLQNRLSRSDAEAEEKLRCVQQELQTLRARVQSLDDALTAALADKQTAEETLARMQKENDALRGQLNDARDDLLRMRDAKAPSRLRGKK